MRSNPTASWPPYEKYTFLRGTDAPLTRRGRLVLVVVFTIIIALGVFLVVMSR